MKKKVGLILGVALLVGGGAQAFDELSLKKLMALNACEGCDLSKANLSEANLTETNLQHANLKQADLSGADLSAANLKSAKLDGAILCKTKMPWGEDNTGCI